MYYSSVLGLDLGMFYKRRDYSTIVNGKNPIVAHEFLGNDIHGKGIEPDLEVELDEEAAQEVVIPEEKDNQLQKAVEVVKGK